MEVRLLRDPALARLDTKPCGSMLEDQKIQHLISWTANSDSFVIQPSHEFSRVLAYVSALSRVALRPLLTRKRRQYFKHTNISSFVRQLNMYGFHKGKRLRKRGVGSSGGTGQSLTSSQ